MKILLQLILCCMLISCEKRQPDAVADTPDPAAFLLSVDISSYPEIADTHPRFFDEHGKEGDFLTLLKQNGINTIRLRLWVNPAEGHCGFGEVREFSKIVRLSGFRLWLSLHYSDSWADPSRQETPREWQHLKYNTLKDTVFHYTQRVIREIKPDYIQIGNEINDGFLHPVGKLSDHPGQLTGLLDTAIHAVRTENRDIRIILHYAGLSGAEWFYDQMDRLDYDMIGLSFYPVWHGKSLSALRDTMEKLGARCRKAVLIAETAYPFTLGWNDQTHNVVGLEEQLILPDYPATPEGQQQFIRQIIDMAGDVPEGAGMCYWGAELIAWKGYQSAEGSPWENQAVFDFNNKALPVLRAFHQH